MLAALFQNPGKQPMKKATKFLAAASLLLAACGGSGGNPALSKSFSYGAAAAPSSTETAAATSAQSNLSQTAGFSSQPDAYKGAAIIGFADALASAALGSAAIPGRGPSGGDLTGALRTAADFTACSTVTASSVSFNNCQLTESGFTITLNGHVSVSAGTVTWAITGGFSGLSSGYTINIVNHQAGTLSLTASKISGNATSDFSGSVSGQGQNVNFGLATAVVLDLTYQSSPNYCVTGGTAEVKRVWTNRPNGASGPQFNDAAVKFTWSGCNAVQVAHGT